MGSTIDENELLVIYEETNIHLNSANMPLRKQASNNVKKTPKYVLGLIWHINTDSLSLKPVKLTIPQFWDFCSIPFNCFDYILFRPKHISKDIKFMIRDLGLYLDTEYFVIKSRDRVQHSNSSFNAKHPIFMSFN